MSDKKEDPIVKVTVCITFLIVVVALILLFADLYLRIMGPIH